MPLTSPADPLPQALPPFACRAALPAAAGLLALLSLLAQPVPPAVLAQAPALAALPVLAQRAVLLVNPLLLLAVATVLGALLAHRVGLGSLLAGTARTTGWPRQLAGAAGIGLATGLLLAAVDAAVAPHLGSPWQQLAAARPFDASALVIGVLYGGIAEELMLRWGLMSLLAWALLALLGPARTRFALATALAAAALAFGAAHLPALAAQVEPTPALLARTVLLNAAAGAVYGWLFWRRHLEAAMAAHAATHLGMAAWRALPL